MDCTQSRWQLTVWEWGLLSVANKHVHALVFCLPCPQKFVSHLIIMWGKFLQYSMISVWPTWGPPAVQQQRPHQNNCSCQLSSPLCSCPRVYDTQGHTHTHTKHTSHKLPMKKTEILSGWPGCSPSTALAKLTDRLHYPDVWRRNMKLDCVFSGGHQQIDATEPAEATQECSDLSVSQPPGGPRTAWPSDWSKISL